jgi:hypothetical protein
MQSLHNRRDVLTLTGGFVTGRSDGLSARGCVANRGASFRLAGAYFHEWNSSCSSRNAGPLGVLQS